MLRHIHVAIALGVPVPLCRFAPVGSTIIQSEVCLELTEEKGGEGIEFLAVRHAIFLDVPWRLADYKQRCGRVVRCGSHNGLSESERTVRFSFLAARFPEFARKDLGAFALFAFCGSHSIQAFLLLFAWC